MVLFLFLCQEESWHPCSVSLCSPQEPPKEDLTVSEKFQLVLDVAQKAQVREAASKSPITHPEQQRLMSCFYAPFRTSLARWPTCWRKSRSKDRIMGHCPPRVLFSHLFAFVCLCQPVYVGAA